MCQSPAEPLRNSTGVCSPSCLSASPMRSTAPGRAGPKRMRSLVEHTQCPAWLTPGDPSHLRRDAAFPQTHKRHLDAERVVLTDADAVSCPEGDPHSSSRPGPSFAQLSSPLLPSPLSLPHPVLLLSKRAGLFLVLEPLTLSSIPTSPRPLHLAASSFFSSASAPLPPVGL